MDVRGARKSGLKKIGEVAALFRTTPRTLLYYEEQGIIHPLKTSGGTRMYSDADIRRFGAAYELASLGIAIRSIRELVGVWETVDSGEEAARKLGLLLEGLIGDLDQQIARLQRVTDNLTRCRDVVEDACEKADLAPLTDGEADRLDGEPDAMALVRREAKERLSQSGQAPVEPVRKARAPERQPG